MKPFFLKKQQHTGKLGFYCLQQRVQTDLQKQYTDIIYKNKIKRQVSSSKDWEYLDILNWERKLTIIIFSK